MGLQFRYREGKETAVHALEAEKVLYRVDVLCQIVQKNVKRTGKMLNFV